MIKWNGKSGNGIWRRSATAENMSELYNACVDNDAISLDDYDPIEKYIIERAGLDYKTTLDEILEEYGVDYDKYFTDKGINTFLTDKEIYTIISHERGNAYYQEFTNENDEPLEFNEDGYIINA